MCGDVLEPAESCDKGAGISNLLAIDPRSVRGRIPRKMPQYRVSCIRLLPDLRQKRGGGDHSQSRGDKDH